MLETMNYTTEQYRGGRGPVDCKGKSAPGSLALEWPTGFAGTGWVVRDEAGAVVYANAFHAGCLAWIAEREGATKMETQETQPYSVSYGIRGCRRECTRPFYSYDAACTFARQYVGPRDQGRYAIVETREGRILLTYGMGN